MSLPSCEFKIQTRPETIFGASTTRTRIFHRLLLEPCSSLVLVIVNVDSQIEVCTILRNRMGWIMELGIQANSSKAVLRLSHLTENSSVDYDLEEVMSTSNVTMALFLWLR